MTEHRTIRNCLPKFRFRCPKQWEQLTATDTPNVRHCGECERLVYLCVTDEETIAHAKAGDCIALALLGDGEESGFLLGEVVDE